MPAQAKRPGSAIKLRPLCTTSWRELKANYLPLFAVAVVVFAIAHGVQHLISHVIFDVESPAIKLTSAPFLILFTVIADVAYPAFSERVVSAEHLGHRRPGLIGAFRGIPWFSLIIADIAIAAIFTVGLGLLVVPGLVAGAFLLLVPPLLVMERKGVISTFKRSIALTKGNFKQLFLISTICYFAFPFMTDAIAEAIDPLLGSEAERYVIADVLPSALVAPFAAVPIVMAAVFILRAERKAKADTA